MAAFLSITINKTNDDNSIPPNLLNTKYEKYLNENYSVHHLSFNTTLFVDSEGYSEKTYSKQINQSSHIYYFGNLISNPNQNLLEKPLAGVYCLIKDTMSELTIEADGLGYYPIFYLQTENTLFVSDRQEFIASAYYKHLKLNKTAVIEFAIMEIINGKNSFYEGIKRLNTDQKISINHTGIKIHQINHSLYKPISTRELLEHYKQVVEGIETKYNFLEIKLSGGYDSRINLALLLKFSSIPKYCITHPTNKFDVAIAEQIASHYNLEHYVLSSKQTKDQYYLKYSGQNSIVVTGQCGELSRSFYYSNSQHKNNIQDFFKQYLPISKRVFLSKEITQIVTESVLTEIEVLKKNSVDNNDLFRIFDWIYLNRARTTFSFQMTSMKVNFFQFPLLVNEYWFRHRLGFSFEQVQKKENYLEVFKAFDNYITSFPFKAKSVLSKSPLLLDVNKAITLYRNKSTLKFFPEDALGIFPEKTLPLLNNQANIRANYSSILASIQYTNQFR